MPRIDLDEEEVALIKERRRKREVTDTWNEAIALMTEKAMVVFSRMVPAEDDSALRDKFARALKEIATQQFREHKA